MVWGPPKCCKTFVVLDLVLHIALGWSYRGRPVNMGAVVYLALEGAYGMTNRIVAWRRRRLTNGRARDFVPFYLLDVRVHLPTDENELIAAIRTQADRPASS